MNFRRRNIQQKYFIFWFPFFKDPYTNKNDNDGLTRLATINNK